MATFNQYFTVSGLVASGDLSSSQYKIVKLASTAGAVIVAAAATDKILGVLLNDPTDGQPAEVAVGGVAKVLAEASVAVGDHVAASTTARAKTTTTGNDHVLGVALEPVTSAGDLIKVAIAISNY